MCLFTKGAILIANKYRKHWLAPLLIRELQVKIKLRHRDVHTGIARRNKTVLPIVGKDVE